VHSTTSTDVFAPRLMMKAPATGQRSTVAEIMRVIGVS
jgi:hypothetical protein